MNLSKAIGINLINHDCYDSISLPSTSTAEENRKNYLWTLFLFTFAEPEAAAEAIQEIIGKSHVTLGIVGKSHVTLEVFGKSRI